MSDKPNRLWDEYIRWSLLSPAQRGSVASKAEWSRAKGVTDRTLRRWEQDERFKARLDELSSRVTTDVGASSVVGDLEVSADEQDYHVVKSQLVEGAKQGNQKALDLYFRTYGKQFVEEEAASRVSDFSSMDLDALVIEAVVSVGEDSIVSYLRSNGWTVERVSV